MQVLKKLNRTHSALFCRQEQQVASHKVSEYGWKVCDITNLSGLGMINTWKEIS